MTKSFKLACPTNKKSENKQHAAFCLKSASRHQSNPEQTKTHRFLLDTSSLTQRPLIARTPDPEKVARSVLSSMSSRWATPSKAKDLTERAAGVFQFRGFTRRALVKFELHEHQTNGTSATCTKQMEQHEFAFLGPENAPLPHCWQLLHGKSAATCRALLGDGHNPHFCIATPWKIADQRSAKLSKLFGACLHNPHHLHCCLAGQIAWASCTSLPRRCREKLQVWGVLGIARIICIAVS